jgi:CheY-like chemotaxis protein
VTDPNLQDARILIVDDQETNILFLEGLLHEGGYRCWRGVLDSRAAAAACAEFQPDLILLDLLMPELDGFGVLAQLQPFLAAQAYLPILVLTVDLTPESRRRALAAGAKDSCPSASTPSRCCCVSRTCWRRASSTASSSSVPTSASASRRH